ncbi:MAG TPA: ATP-binding protein [Vicinamibacterales bacterium]
MDDRTLQSSAAASLAASERRLVAQSDALTDLTTRYTNPSDRFEDRLESILAIAADALAVERLSMWEFVDDHRSIRCVGLHHRSRARYESGALLTRQDAPAYFDAVECERVIAAADARVDPCTREFRDSYLVPNDIGAMLDVPLRHDNRTIGVLCAEHVGSARAWTLDEQNFGISVGNLIVIAVAEDQRRTALARLAESDARAHTIIDTAHDAYIGIDSRGLIVTWNAQAEATLGWTRDEAIGRSLAETVIPPAFRDAHVSGMRRFHQTGEAPVVNQRIELRALHRSGREIPIELTVTSPMQSEHGYFFGAFIRDISSRLERDDELRRAKETAEAATRAKSEFLTNMSHELRTPLNGVLGYAQLLQRDRGLNGSQREALEAIATCGSQLLDLINDILDLSKIEAGRLDIEDAVTDLTRLVSNLAPIVSEAAERKGLRVTTSIGSDVPRLVVIDGRRVRQVLLNLLGNAVKFTSAGEVRLTIAIEGDQLKFEVTDTGPGIEPEALTKIFSAFSQTKTGAAAGGTGLGLTICDRLITRMGGELRVDSVLGEGSRFSFMLPLVEARPGVRAAARTGDAVPTLDARLAPGQSITAMVVDDSTANRHILTSLLESAGVRAVGASGGVEAIERARADRPQIIFMDLKMDDLDGFEATRRIARDPMTAAIPVVAVTASALGNSSQRAREAGCVDYLSKPVRVELLFAMLQKHLGARFISEHAAAASADTDLKAFDRRAEVGTRLRAAIALGDVGDIQNLARHLLQGSAAEAAVGERVQRLVAHFDFDGLRELVDSLES